jgi:hypothetical protein
MNQDSPADADKNEVYVRLTSMVGGNRGPDLKVTNLADGDQIAAGFLVKGFAKARTSEGATRITLVQSGIDVPAFNPLVDISTSSIDPYDFNQAISDLNAPGLTTHTINFTATDDLNQKTDVSVTFKRIK